MFPRMPYKLGYSAVRTSRRRRRYVAVILAFVLLAPLAWLERDRLTRLCKKHEILRRQQRCLDYQLPSGSPAPPIPADLKFLLNPRSSPDDVLLFMHERLGLSNQRYLVFVFGKVFSYYALNPEDHEDLTLCRCLRYTAYAWKAATWRTDLSFASESVGQTIDLPRGAAVTISLGHASENDGRRFEIPYSANGVTGTIDGLITFVGSSCEITLIVRDGPAKPYNPRK
jgi:hypothetical protein